MLDTSTRHPPSLERIRALALAIAAREGHTAVQSPDLCLYRWTRSTRLVKAATFGVVLGVVLQGAKDIYIDGTRIPLDSSRLTVITRDTEIDTHITEASEERPFLGLSLLFGPERVARALLAVAEAGGPASRETVPAFSLPLEPALLDAIERLLRTLDDPLERRLIAPLVLDEILFRLLRSDAAAAVRAGVGPAQDAGRILEAMKYVRANHAKKLTVESLARLVAMSPSHFAHRFAAVARLSPMRYVREVRLERARLLLAEHGARAGEVGHRVGFDSAAHFAREFKRRFGVPPSRYAAAPSAGRTSASPAATSAAATSMSR